MATIICDMINKPGVRIFTFRTIDKYNLDPKVSVWETFPYIQIAVTTKQLKQIERDAQKDGIILVRGVPVSAKTKQYFPIDTAWDSNYILSLAHPPMTQEEFKAIAEKEDLELKTYFTRDKIIYH